MKNKKLLSALITLTLVFSAVPGMAVYADTKDGEKPVATQEADADSDSEGDADADADSDADADAEGDKDSKTDAEGDKDATTDGDADADSEPEPTEEPTPTPVPTKTPKEKIREFVNRMYLYVLARAPEEKGAEFWTNQLYNFNTTGADLAFNFVFSEEYINANYNDTKFVKTLYRTFFGRLPEDDGLAYWKGLLAGGTSREEVAYGFIYSQEWADTCAKYGIRSGGTLAPQVEIEPTDATYAFVERMYTTAMKRESDPDGKNYWAKQLANFSVTGEAVGANFFLSDEMAGYNLDNTEFVNRLYATFMDREADPDGLSYWLSQMSSGASRADIVYGFTRSPEFAKRCISARILPS